MQSILGMGGVRVVVQQGCGCGQDRRPRRASAAAPAPGPVAARVQVARVTGGGAGGCSMGGSSGAQRVCGLAPMVVHPTAAPARAPGELPFAPGVLPRGSVVVHPTPVGVPMLPTAGERPRDRSGPISDPFGVGDPGGGSGPAWGGSAPRGVLS
jgi:hypothetical protein